MNILLINNHGIGDVIMSMSSINYLLQNKANKLLILLKSKSEINFFRSTCLFARYSHRISLYSKKSVIMLFLFFFRLNYCYSFGSSAKKSLLLSFSLFCFKVKIASPYVYKINCFNRFVFVNSSKLHKHNFFLNCVSGTPFSSKRYTLQCTKYDKAFINSIVFCVGSGSNEKHKRWSAKNYVQLVEKLVSFCNHKIYFVGSKPEEKLIENIFNSLKTSTRKSAFNLCNKTSFVDLFSIFSSCKYVIGTDNGILHIANFCNANILSIFGPTDFNITGPTGSNVHVINRGYSCSPCYLVSGNINGCGVNACMQDITVNQVLNNMIYNLDLRYE